MATMQKKQKQKWDVEAERKLIDIWADILSETNGKMLSRKSKEQIATKRLHEYVSEELRLEDTYSEKAVGYKIDSLIKKGKQMYSIYQKKGETGKELEDKDLIDVEKAKLSWPNFDIFYERFKDHPSLGPGSVEESCKVPTPMREEVVASCSPDVSTPSSSRCPSRASKDEDEDWQDVDDEDDDGSEDNPPKKRKVTGKGKQARVGKRSGSSAMTQMQFMSAFSETQERMQAQHMEHKRKMQQEAIAFQQQMEQDRIKFEAQLSSNLQQQNNKFQLDLVQQNQLFQAEIFKRLFEKLDK